MKEGIRDPKGRVTDCVVEVTKRYYVRIEDMHPIYAGAKVEEACKDPDKRTIITLIGMQGRRDPDNLIPVYRFAGFHEVKIMPAKCLPIPLGKYMWAMLQPPRPPRLTDTWRVQAESGDLGAVYWHGSWRCYAFHPNQNTVFNAECMLQLANFTAEQTALYRAKPKDPV